MSRRKCFVRTVTKEDVTKKVFCKDCYERGRSGCGGKAGVNYSGEW